MLQRYFPTKRLAAALAAAWFGAASWGALAAPADDLKEAQKLYGQGKLQPALDKVDTFLKTQPRDPQGRFLKGLLLTEQKRTADAIQVFTGLTEDYPELPEPYNNLAVLYASQGNYDKAKSALELAIHTHPSYATAHENLGDIYAQLASRAYDRALQLDKNNTTAQAKLGLVKELFSKGGSGQQRPTVPAATPTATTAPAGGTEKSEPTKVAVAPPPAPKAEPAKPVEPPKAPAAAVTPKPAPAAAPSQPAASGGEEAAIAASIQQWASAWSAKDVKGYLAAYAPDFEPPAGEKRAAWEKQRAERIERPKKIDVEAKVLSTKISGNEATVTIRQAYKSDTLKSNSTKVLRMVKNADRWLIKQERAGS